MKTPLALVAALAMTPSTWACLCPPASYAGAVRQAAQEAIVFWNAGREELIVRLSYDLEPAGRPRHRLEPRVTEGLPASLAWVIPVPTVPDSYGEASPALFSDLLQHWRCERDRDETGAPTTPDAVVPDAELDLELLEQVSVGAYQVQPLRAVGPAGARALDAWLTEHGYGPVPAALLSHYVEREWVWLAVRVVPGQDAGFGPVGTLRPLRISFASPRVVYPLKLSAGNEGPLGYVDVRLWIVTDQPLPDLSHDHEARFMPLPDSLDRFMQARERFPALDNRVGAKVPHVTRVELGASPDELNAWKEDLAFDPPAPVPASAQAARLAVRRGPDAGVLARVERLRLQLHLATLAIADAVAAGDRLAALRGHTGSDLVRHARALTWSGDPRRALAQLDAAEAKGDVRPITFGENETLDDLWIERARAHVRLDDLARAEDCAVKAASYEFASVYAHLWAARLAAARGRARDALARLETALARCDDRYDRASVLRTRGLVHASAPATRALANADLLAAAREDDDDVEALAWYHALNPGQRWLDDTGPGWSLIQSLLAGLLPPSDWTQETEALEDPWERRALRGLGWALFGVRSESDEDPRAARQHYAACARAAPLSGDAWWWARLRAAAR